MISGCEVYLSAFGSFRCYWFMSLFNNFLPWFLKCSGKPQSKNHVILTTQSYDRSKYNYPVQLCNPFKDHVLHRWLHHHRTLGRKLKPSKIINGWMCLASSANINKREKKIASRRLDARISAAPDRKNR